jgi:hypothetical protein
MKTTLILLVTSLALISPALADMKGARNHAEKVLQELQNSTADKGGHRTEAMKHLKAAIAAIDAGIAFDKANVTKSEGKKKGKK